MGFPNLIIGITGNAMDDELTDFLDGGADLVISKPMRSNMLEMLLTFFIKNGPISFAENDKRLVVNDRTMDWQTYFVPSSDLRCASSHLEEKESVSQGLMVNG